MKRSFIVIISIVIFFLFGGILISSAQDADIKRAEQLSQQTKQLYKQRKFSEAVPIAKELLAIFEEKLGPEHPKTAESLHNLAELYKAMGDYTKAEQLDKRALAIPNKIMEPDQPGTAQSKNNLAELKASKGNDTSAKSKNIIDSQMRFSVGSFELQITSVKLGVRKFLPSRMAKDETVLSVVIKVLSGDPRTVFKMEGEFDTWVSDDAGRRNSSRSCIGMENEAGKMLFVNWRFVVAKSSKAYYLNFPSGVTIELTPFLP